MLHTAQTPIEQVQVQTRRLVRQIAKMQETLNTLSERLESIDRREALAAKVAKRGGVAHDGEEDSDESGDDSSKSYL